MSEYENIKFFACYGWNLNFATFSSLSSSVEHVNFTEAKNIDFSTMIHLSNLNILELHENILNQPNTSIPNLFKLHTIKFKCNKESSLSIDDIKQNIIFKNIQHRIYLDEEDDKSYTVKLDPIIIKKPDVVSYPKSIQKTLTYLVWLLKQNGRSNFAIKHYIPVNVALEKVFSFVFN